MEYHNEAEQIIVNCGQCLDVSSVSAQRDILIEVFSIKKKIIFEAHELNRVDTAGLQLLLSFTRAATEQDIHWEWHEPSLVLIHVATLLGIREHLRLPERTTVS